jgi:glycosyltransferase involved in cell wall biosynthesis
VYEILFEKIRYPADQISYPSHIFGHLAGSQCVNMRILITNKISPEFGGGGELIIKEIGRRLKEIGHEIFLLTSSELPDSSNLSSSDGVQTYYIPNFLKFLYGNEKLRFLISRYSFYLLSPPYITKFAKELDVDVLHDYASPIPSMATLIGHQLEIPTVLTIHEVLLKKAFKFYDPITALGKLLGDYSLKALSPDHIITVSEFTRSRLLRLGIDAEKISVIANGVNFQTFHPSDNFEKKDDPCVVSVNRLVPQKRVSHIVMAAKKVVEEIPSANFYIIGRGKLENKLRSIVTQMRLNKNVHILGFLSQNDMIRHLQQADVFASASMQEGFGLAAAEAMACGTPVISYDVPALNEIIDNGENGVLVEDGNIRKLSQAIIMFLRDRELAKEYGIAAAQKVEEKYDWNKTIDQLMGVYRKVGA